MMIHMAGHVRGRITFAIGGLVNFMTIKIKHLDHMTRRTCIGHRGRACAAKQHAECQQDTD